MNKKPTMTPKQFVEICMILGMPDAPDAVEHLLTAGYYPTLDDIRIEAERKAFELLAEADSIQPKVENIMAHAWIVGRISKLQAIAKSI